MDKSLSSDTKKQMRDLCRKISVAHDLDTVIQEELFGHMEDKFLAYLSGEETVTEDDALILVREHFGDPAVLKGLLQDVHVKEVHVNFVRRVAAIVAANLGVLVVAGLLICLLDMLLVLWTSQSVSENNLLGLRHYCAEFIYAACRVVLLWLVLRHWQRHLQAGRKPWFLKWHFFSVTVTIVGLLVLIRLVPDVRMAAGVLGTWARPSLFQWLMTPLAISLTLLWPVVWLWWLDMAPRRTRVIVYGLIAWLVFCTVVVLSPFGLPLPQITMLIGASDVTSFSTIIGSSLAHGRIDESSLYWHLRFSPIGSVQGLRVSPNGLALLMARILVLGSIGCLSYVMGPKYYRKYGAPLLRTR